MKTGIIVLLTLVIGAPMAFSQNVGDIGMVFKFSPASIQGIGAHYQVTEEIGLQPSLVFSRSSFTLEEESDDGAKSETDETLSSFGIEVLVPYYLHRIDNISVFAAPGLRYLRTTYDSEFDSNIFWDYERDNTINEFSLILNLGAQANFGRFAVFSSWGLQVFFLNSTQEASPSVSGAAEDFEVTTSGSGFSLSQLSIGTIFTVN